VDVGGLLEGAKLKLYKEPIEPTKATVIADLTPADFTGYAASAAITWGTPLTDTDGTAFVPGGMIEFAASGSTVANTIYGAYLTDGAGTILLGVFRFDTPVSVGAVGQGVLVPLLYRYSGS
jgi:hypothetical protein